ncbi:integrin alpha-E isoform 2-T2 [Hipposideros larvatus]
MWLFHTLLYVTSLAPLVAFNVDVDRTWVTAKEGGPYVLSSLLHQNPQTNETWILVTSPRTNRAAEPLHQCYLKQDKIHCQPVEHVPIPKGRHRGVTVVRSHHGVLICIQVVSRRPNSLSSQLTGTCSLLAPDLHPQVNMSFVNVENLLEPEAHAEAGDCHRNIKGSTENMARWRRALNVEEDGEEEEEEEEAGTEIAIILDGSGSIDPPDFQKAKDFIYNIIKNIYTKCFECSFALVQYGEVIQTEFDLRYSQDVIASLARIQNITQLGNTTRTASAMQHVLDNIFTPSHGSRKKASKVMVVLTDGEIFEDPLNLTTVIKSPKMQGVERFAIGVGNAFNKSKAEDELKLIASDPDETHVFKVTNYAALDGLLSQLQQSIVSMEGVVGEALHYQLAQIGFSAQILDKRQVLLGAVGAFEWSGGALLYDMYSCQGRFLNQTVVDAKAGKQGYLGYSVAVLHKASGLSYVAGAPRHNQHGAVFELPKEGRDTNFMPVLEGEQLGSYFGSELCPVDINMNGTTDFLLVAAPFYHIRGQEGRVYMYRLNEQWIRASKVASGLRYFGMSVDGGLDFSGDGLADITVGTLGQAAVLRSRPVVRLKVSMTFTPKTLPIGFNSSVDVRLCFEISSATTAAESGLREMSLNFTLDVDVVKEKKRLQCLNKRTCQSNLLKLSRGSHLCELLQLIPTEGELCKEDCFSNISVSVSYQLQTPKGQRGHTYPVLDFYDKPYSIFQLPYEKDCKNKLFCVAELQLAIATSQQELVLGVTKELTMNIIVTNSGEDSYMTSMVLHYPRNLHFKRIQKPPSPNIQCDDPKPDASDMVMNCKIGHPILKRSSANFFVVWQLEESAFSNRTANRTADVTVMVVNSNKIRSSDRKTHSLHIRHAFIAVLPKPSVMYMNTSQGLSDHKEFLFNIHGENLFEAKFQLQICVPIKLQGFQLIRVKNLTKTQANTECAQSRKCACGSDPIQSVEEWHSVSCVITSDKENVTVAVDLSLSQSKQLLRSITELQILGEISFDKFLYEGLNAENHRTKITVIFLKDEDYLSLPLIIGSSVGGLLILTVVIVIMFKCGFFNRKYQQLNLESIRKAQLQSEDRLIED